MKTGIVVSLIVIALTLQTVIAATGDLNVSIDSVTIKGVVGSSTINIAGFSSEMVPLKVIFTSNVNVEDAKIKAWIGGYRDDIVVSTRRIHLLNTSVYSELLSIQLPSDIKPSESYTLYVRIETKNKYREEQYNLKIQRESYNTEILDADSEKTVRAGEKLAVDVVLKNRGYEDLEDLFVVVSIPELGVEKRAYFEDLTSEDDSDADKRDSGERTVYLRIPSNAKTGVYNLKIESYNSDSRSVITKKIAVIAGEESSNVVVPITSKQVSVGKAETYELVIVNPGSKVGIYEIIPETSENLVINVDKPVITVKAGNSETVKISVKALKEGTYSFKIDVNSDNMLVKKLTLNAIASKESTGSNWIIFTVVLVIVFVVLVIVLIVLLTRKPTKNELEESYY